MSITVTCQCGKQMKVAAKFAGRRAKCPACGEAFIIPTPEASPDVPPDVPPELPPDSLIEPPSESPQDQHTQEPSDNLDLLYESLSQPGAEAQPVSADTCNACGKPMPAGAVLCTACGFHSISHTYLKVANAADANEKESKAPLLTLAGMGMRWWKVALVVIPLGAASFWYFTGPARDVLVADVQTVNLVESIHKGETREPFSLFTQQGDMSLGIKAPKSKSNPHPLIGGDEVYSLGDDDDLLVVKPDDAGDHIMLEVGLKQGTIQSMERTIRYDSVIDSEDFKLIPSDGGPPLDARLLYKRFGSDAEVDLGGADTRDYQALFPSEPTVLDVDKANGSINGQATWSGPNARGKISFYASYPYGDYPAGKGLSANGKIKLTNHAGTSVNMAYEGDTLNVDWDADASGWWAKGKYKHMSQPSPWYRYEFGLLFERPDAGGDYQLTYCDQHVATVSIEPAPPPKVPAVSPIKRAQGQGKPAVNPNNPLSYFTMIADARQQAKGIVSANNLRQIGLGLQIYLDQNGQVWPEQLDQIKTVMGGFDQVMVNPRTGEKVGFIYVRPEPGADPATTGVLYEAFQGQPDPNGAVLYADGHIQ